MRLAEALRIGPRQVVAFAGAGGKSTAMGCLAAELAPDTPVVVTSTTRLALSQRSLARAHLILRNPSSLDALPETLAAERSIVVTGVAARNEPKWFGLEPALLDRVHRMASDAGAVLLIEADGARGRSLKAPADHEPVIPDFADLVVPVAAMDVLGTEPEAGRVHRPDRVSQILGLGPGEVIREEHLARWIGDPRAALKGIPAQAEVRVLLNKCDSPGALRSARRVAEAGLVAERVRALVLGNVASERPAVEVIGRVAGVILAAGQSRRLGQPKQLVSWKGRPLVWHAARAAFEGGLAPVVVVVGRDQAEIVQALRNEPVRIVRNPDWERGLSTSVRAGLAAEAGTAEAVVFLLADTPAVESSLVHALVQEHRRSLTPLVAPRVGDRWANPVLFDRVTFPALRRLEGDQGGRALFDRYRMAGIEWDPSILLDIDTPDDLRRLEGLR